MLSAPHLSQRFFDKRDRSGHIPQNNLMREPEDAEAEPSEPLISARIILDATGVTAPVHLYDELGRRRHEIDDEFADHNLAPKCNSKLTPAELAPQSRFGTIQIAAHCGRATFEQLASFSFDSSHRDLPSPAEVPSFEAPGAGCVTRHRTFSPSRLHHRITCSPRRQRGAQRAPLRRSSAPTRARFFVQVAPRQGEVNPRLTHEAQTLPCASERPLSAPQPLGPSPARSAPGSLVRASTTRASTGLRASTARSNASTDGRHFSATSREQENYQSYGAVESSYRPGRWGSFREPYKFTGKEEDIEVGLVYFGFRYLNPLLQRWISADPLAIHDPGSGDLNVYAYVRGRALIAVDATGLDWDLDVVVAIGNNPVLNNLANRGAGIVDGAVSLGKLALEDPGAAAKAVVVGTVAGAANLVKDTGEALGDIAYESTHYDGEKSKDKIISRSVDVLLNTADLVTAVKGAAQSAVKGVGAAKSIAGKIKAGAVDATDVGKGAAAVLCPCFAAGTLVPVLGGMKAIENIRVGDLVLSKDEATGEETYRAVTRTFITPDKALLDLTFQQLDGTYEVVRATPNHPFYVEGSGWVVASDLALGTTVQTAEAGLAQLTAALALLEHETVYNFEVADTHTYFVGMSRHWVHNACKCGGGEAPGRAGKQARLKEIATDPNTSSADRGWIKQERNAIERGHRSNIRNPPGKDLAHTRGREAAKGYDHVRSPSKLQDRDLHRTQHKYDNGGRRNKPRP